MRYREGLRVDMIARQLARSASAISVQLFAVRKLLRDCVRRKLAHADIGIEPDTPHGPA